MQRTSFLSFSETGTKFTLFLFFSLLFLSTAFFVFADNHTGAGNIFADSDQDGLSNDEERLYGTDSSAKDSDGDGYSDGIEVESGYDPLKPAPGDKIFNPSLSSGQNQSLSSGENLTQKTAGEIASILKTTDESGQPVTLDEVNASVQKVLSGNTDDIVLPQVDIKDIKIKKLPKNLKEKNRAEAEREDALEYLTVVSYLMASNSPGTFQNEEELGGMLTGISGDAVSAMLSGNTEYVTQLSKRGEKILAELKEVEVPEKMLDIHVKALKMAKYAVELKSELKPSQEDPLGQIAVLAKAQGFFGSVSGFMDEVHVKLVDYGIEEIPLNL